MNKLQHLAATAALGFAALLASAGSQASTVTVDVSGAQSINQLGEVGNTVWFVEIGATALLTSLDWALQLNAFSPSTLSDMQVSFGSSSGLDMFTLTPAQGNGTSGIGSYTGSLDLTSLGITAGTDGLLRIEFSEVYKDFANGVTEGEWVSGTLGLGVTAAAVPEPASGALAALGLGLLGLQTRRARRG